MGGLPDLNTESAKIQAYVLNFLKECIDSGADGFRFDATSLYFARTNGYRAGKIGEIGTYDWKNPEVIAVNKFHNYFNGESEYLASSGRIAYNERGKS